MLEEVGHKDFARADESSLDINTLYLAKCGHMEVTPAQSNFRLVISLRGSILTQGEVYTQERQSGVVL
jgi:hypothetical protein